MLKKVAVVGGCAALIMGAQTANAGPIVNFTFVPTNGSPSYSSTSFTTNATTFSITPEYGDDSLLFPGAAPASPGLLGYNSAFALSNVLTYGPLTIPVYLDWTVTLPGPSLVAFVEVLTSVTNIASGPLTLIYSGLLNSSNADFVNAPVYMEFSGNFMDISANLVGGPTTAISWSGADTSTNPMPGVPEAATWALMLVGLGGMGAALRRGRAKLATAAV